MTDADARRARVVVHELGHALTGRSCGWRIRTVVTTPSANNVTGWCDHYPKDGLSPLEAAIDDVTILLAGDLAAAMVPVSGFLPDVDGCAERARAMARAALERLPAAEGAFVYHVLSDTRLSTTDAERAEWIGREAAGEEFGLFMAFCGARAQRLVAANLQLIEVLLPVALANPILTGEDVEQAIEAARTGQEGS